MNISKKSNKTKDLLIKTTIDILFKFGFKNATDSFICQEANLTRGALYHHYKNGKVDLLKDVLNYLNEKITIEMSHIYNENFKEILLLGIENMLHNTHQTIDINSIAMLELTLAIRHDEKIREILLPLLQENEKIFWNNQKNNPNYGMIKFVSTFFKGYILDLKTCNDINELNKSLEFLKKLLINFES